MNMRRLLPFIAKEEQTKSSDAQDCRHGKPRASDRHFSRPDQRRSASNWAARGARSATSGSAESPYKATTSRQIDNALRRSGGSPRDGMASASINFWPISFDRNPAV